jgi:glycine/D-amino acid oxidase-like deaminating enzyme
MSRVRGAVGCSTRNAGSVHPHKFTTELLKLAIASERDHISLFTGTPVIDVSETQASSGQDVRTNRGIIRAKQIILCTNAHTPHLFPEDHPLKTFIFPSRQKMGLVTPTTSFAGTRALQTTYGFPKGYCATTSGGIVVGLGERVYVSEGCGSAEDFIGNSDDTTVLPGCTELLHI